MHEREIRVATSDGDMVTFVVHPDGDGPWPVAVLFMDGVGYREQVKDNARRFAAAGYWCTTPDLFHRSAEGVTFDFAKAADETYRARLMEVVSSVTPDAALADTEAVVTDGPDSPHHDLATVRGELYFAFAEIDHSATEELVDRFRQELEQQGVEGVVERLPGVSHGFAMADLPVYDQTAAERHFERTLDLWRRSLDAERLGA